MNKWDNNSDDDEIEALVDNLLSTDELRRNTDETLRERIQQSGRSRNVSRGIRALIYTVGIPTSAFFSGLGVYEILQETFDVMEKDYLKHLEYGLLFLMPGAMLGLLTGFGGTLFNRSIHEENRLIDGYRTELTSRSEARD